MSIDEKRKSVERFFNDLLGMIDMPSFYKMREKKIEEDEYIEELALKLGFLDDEYYTAKEKMELENKNSLSADTGASGSLGHVATRC